MDKTFLTILVFCFAVFSASAQVESTKPDSKKNQVEQSKISNARATEASQADQQTANPNAAVISFDKMVHDYGTLAYAADGNCEFTFTNVGKEPLVLTNVKAS
jgi:hypothetical protein